MSHDSSDSCNTSQTSQGSCVSNTVSFINNKTLLLAKAVLLLLVSAITLYHALSLYETSLAGLHALVPSSNTTTFNSTLSLTDALSGKQPHSVEFFANDTQNMFHFIQISDVHVSRFRNRGGVAHLRHFLDYEMNLIAPDLVLATGDLTDAKSHSTLTSLQHREEWVAYHTTLQNSGVLLRQKGRFWWDQRGNHDCFNIPSFQSSENMYRTLSSVKKEGYSFHLRKDFGVYSFIAIDACPEVGATRPINFFGYFDTNDMDFLASEILAGKRLGHNHTFVMSHYPTSTTLFGRTSNDVSFWDLSQNISIWLCGHLHKLAAGLGETMYAFQGTFLELELADLKSHGVYRIIVVDHDLVSFIDLPIFTPILPMPHESPLIADAYASTRPPIVLVTNPKDGRFILPGREPVGLIRGSHYIRVLVWSERIITSVCAQIDGVPLLVNGTYQGKGNAWKTVSDEEPNLPLWIIPWTPSAYDNSKPHLLVVTATNEANVSSNHSLFFRVDGERIPEMDAGMGGFIIGLQFGILFKDLFVISYIIVSIVFLLLPKLFVIVTQYLGTYDAWYRTTSAKLVARDKAVQLYLSMTRFATLSERIGHMLNDFIFTIRATFFRFCRLVTYSELFYPLYFFNLYLLVGPWFIGEFVPSAPVASGRRYGWMMIYGIWFGDGTWTPLLDNWLFAFYGIMYSVLPLEFYLSFCCTSPSLLYTPTNPRLFRPIHRRWYVHLMVVLALIYHITDALSMAIFYGAISAIVSPAKTWLTLWAAVILWIWRSGPRSDAVLGYNELGEGFAGIGNGPGELTESRDRLHDHAIFSDMGANLPESRQLRVRRHKPM
ncbi:hypothetical protein BASA60_005484 [Batrachochytrium salamandrivorans]|nr:hypothetical protein BASA60_005484 [Batrachochytrium salamandrivorans]